MKIDLERFLALTSLLAAPLVTASGCVLTGIGDDDDGNGTDDGQSADDGNGPTGDPSSADDAPMTDDAGTVGDTGTETGGGTTDDDGTAGTTGADTSGGLDTTGGNALGNCCEAHEEASCEFMEVADCVCAEDPFCCDTMWDATCVSSVNALGCGECVLPPTVWDCYCTADCDGTLVETPWQVCTDDEIEATELGTAACEADLGSQCDTFVCDECGCFTAEVPEIDCR